MSTHSSLYTTITSLKTKVVEHKLAGLQEILSHLPPDPLWDDIKVVVSLCTNDSGSTIDTIIDMMAEMIDELIQQDMIHQTHGFHKLQDYIHNIQAKEQQLSQQEEQEADNLLETL